MSFLEWLLSILLTIFITWTHTVTAFLLVLVFGRNSGIEYLPAILKFLLFATFLGFLTSLHFVWDVDLFPFI